MRLIDADKLLSNLNDYALTESPTDSESTGEHRLSIATYNVIQKRIQAAEEQPIAYDVDKVVEQLDNYPHGGYINVETMNDLIEIVKAGGIDE